MGAKIYFNTTGSQTLRIQSREDGLSIDQIILSPNSSTFLNASPGALKNDTKIYAETQGSMAALTPWTLPAAATALPALWAQINGAGGGIAGKAPFDLTMALIDPRDAVRRMYDAGAKVAGTLRFTV
jgi:hypothetical protein